MQIINRLAEERQAALPQLTAEMKNLCAALEKASSLLETLRTKTYDFLADFESDFAVRIPTIRPEVPKETRQLFVTLFKLVDSL
jgi:hypothetical protein